MPSSSTGTPRRGRTQEADADRQVRRPSPASRARGSATRSPIRCRAWVRTAVLLANRSSSIPCPADHLLGPDPEARRDQGGGGVVLPMPMSPRSAGRHGLDLRLGHGPADRQCLTHCSAVSASRRGIGSDGPMWYAETQPAGRPGVVDAEIEDPRATSCCGKQLAAATPATKARPMAAVTSRGYADTAFVRDAVVPGQDDRPDPVQRSRWAFALAGRQPGGQVLHPTERADRLGQRLEALAGVGVDASGGGTDHVRTASWPAAGPSSRRGPAYAPGGARTRPGRPRGQPTR